jgi:two-component system LytT family response regulator
LLKQYCPEIHVCGIAASAEEGRRLLENNFVDFIFLDISMPREDGFAFLHSIPSGNYGVIFATAFQEHALRALKANAIDYLLKPINPFELQEAVKKAIYNHELRNNHSDLRDVYKQSLNNLQDHMLTKENPAANITITEQFGFRLVNLSELIYLQADNNYTILHLTGDRVITATKTLGEFEKILGGPEFFRIHKSTIINLNFLVGYSSFQGNYADMRNGTRLDISRRKVSEFRERVRNHSISID